MSIHEQRGAGLRRAAISIAVIAASGSGLLIVLESGGASPRPVAIESATPQELATQITDNDATLREAVDSWRASGGDPPATPPPVEVALPARYVQGVTQLLAKDRTLAAGTLPLLAPALASEIRELTLAARALLRLSKGSKHRKLEVGSAPPLAELVGHYGAAQRASGVGPGYLAAIHLVETKFGKVKSKSVAGAKGPMQFIPSTWRIYGKDGDINDPRDAIFAAARLLRDKGAPGNYKRALYSYNPSTLYVEAVRRYARVINGDPYVLPILYCWEP